MGKLNNWYDQGWLSPCDIKSPDCAVITNIRSDYWILSQGLNWAVLCLATTRTTRFWFSFFDWEKFQVVRHLSPPATLNLASTSIVLECSASPCFALLTIDPDPGVLSCGSTLESQRTVETFCQESGKVIQILTNTSRKNPIIRNWQKNRGFLFLLQSFDLPLR